MKTAVLAAAMMMIAASAHAKDARCLLKVDGKTWISGTCDFQDLGMGDGSFMITGKNDHFAYANWDGERMRGSWNGPQKASRAHEELGPMSRDKRDKACWINDNARICAW